MEKVERSDWAAPVVLVPKRDGSIRLCGDYKLTVNRHLDVDQYPLPIANDLFVSLTGGKKFTKLDLAQAYQQMALEEQSQTYCTINTHQGLYRFNRLPFGVASAPAIFQRTMDTILQGIPHVLCYIDDLLITGETEEEHLRNLEEVLKRLQDHGIVLKKSKCFFLQDSVEYLGHIIDAEGLHHPNQQINTNYDLSWGFFSTMGSSFTIYQHFYLHFMLCYRIHPGSGPRNVIKLSSMLSQL